MKKGDRVICNNEPGCIAKIEYIYSDGTADIRYSNSKYVVSVSLDSLSKV
ncbi:MAG: hypothetical protein RR137_10905 [Odoribacter sp.]